MSNQDAPLPDSIQLPISKRQAIPRTVEPLRRWTRSLFHTQWNRSEIQSSFDLQPSLAFIQDFVADARRRRLRGENVKA